VEYDTVGNGVGLEVGDGNGDGAGVGTGMGIVGRTVGCGVFVGRSVITL
jgi:hypothetical protein